MKEEHWNILKLKGWSGPREATASISVMDIPDFSPMMLASQQLLQSNLEFLPIVKDLIEEGADINTTLPTFEFRTVLHWACLDGDSSGSVALAKLLISNGADIECKDCHGKTPLMIAVGGNLNVVKMLVDAGAKIDVVDSFGRNIWSFIKESNQSRSISNFIESVEEKRMFEESLPQSHLEINTGSILKNRI